MIETRTQLHVFAVSKVFKKSYSITDGYSINSYQRKSFQYPMKVKTSKFNAAKPHKIWIQNEKKQWFLSSTFYGSNKLESSFFNIFGHFFLTFFLLCFSTMQNSSKYSFRIHTYSKNSKSLENNNSTQKPSTKYILFFKNHWHSKWW